MATLSSPSLGNAPQMCTSNPQLDSIRFYMPERRCSCHSAPVQTSFMDNLAKPTLSRNPIRYKLHCLPEVVGIEKSRELWVDVDHMDVTLLVIPYHSSAVVPGIVCLHIDSERAVDFELKSDNLAVSHQTFIGLPANFLDTYIVGSSISRLNFVASSPSTP